MIDIVLRDRKPDQWYVEPFAGNMDTIYNVQGNRIANDADPHYISMWREFLKGWVPELITKETYWDVKRDEYAYTNTLRWWVRYYCNDSAGRFSMYHQAKALAEIIGRVEGLRGTILRNADFLSLEVPANSLIYFGPPRHIKYVTLWDYVRTCAKQGHTVFVKRSTAPKDFRCVWSRNKAEKLFTLR